MFHSYPFTDIKGIYMHTTEAFSIYSNVTEAGIANNQKR